MSLKVPPTLKALFTTIEIRACERLCMYGEGVSSNESVCEATFSADHLRRLYYLIDVHLLGSQAFEFGIEPGISLTSILESSSIFKVFFDVRNDSDALHTHFGVHVAGIIDLQVLEYATRRPRGGFVNGLAKCIEKDLPYMPGWSATKTRVSDFSGPTNAADMKSSWRNPYGMVVAGGVQTSSTVRAAPKSIPAETLTVGKSFPLKKNSSTTGSALALALAGEDQTASEEQDDFHDEPPKWCDFSESH